MKAKSVCRMISRMLILNLLACALPAPVQASGPAAGHGVFEYRVEWDGTVTITDCSKEAFGTVAIPSQIEGKPVACIGESAFFDCAGITQIIFPDSLLEIGDYAFSLCTGLQSVVVPDSVAAIGYSAFFACASLETAVLGSGLQYIEWNAFMDCPRLTSVSVSSDNPAYASKDGVLYSKDGSVLLFAPGGMAGAFTVDGGVVTIGKAAFMSCTNLTAVTFPEGLREIDEYAFAWTALTSVTFPKSVTGIGDSAFRYCSSLKEAIFLGDPPKTFSFNVFFLTSLDFAIYYLPENAASWAPGGRDVWYDYPIAVYDPPAQRKLELHENSAYAIAGGILRGIKAGETADSVIANFVPSGILRVFDATGHALSGGALVGTLYEIRLLNDEEALDALVIIVTGDVDGNGHVDSHDIALIQKYILKIGLFTGVYEQAADLDQDGGINSRDIASIQKIILGL